MDVYKKDTRALERAAKETDVSVPQTHEAAVSLMEFASKKTEKLSAALYMVTNFISDNEPIKWELRRQAIVLVSDMLRARNKTIAERLALLSQTRDGILEICALLGVAYAGNLITEMNHRILRREYEHLREFIERDDTEGFSEDILQGMFRGDREKAREIQGAGREVRQDKGQSKGQGGTENDFYKTTDTYYSTHGHSGEKKDTMFGVSGGTLTEHGRALRQKNNPSRGDAVVRPRELKKTRREQILSIIRQKKDVAIKDIAEVIIDCSEKTIQRELVSLVEEGVLNRTGEKRWSRYVLAR